mmetsp:Transcript_30236/g.81249  ORF Transcript_30236/g.81249 Transcript_30236/m.81249 type:complete len:290 (-) Transcript_30236:240-1109(-)
MWSWDWLCRARMERAILRPSPVPPLPCSCPRPTWAKASPLRSTASSSAEMPSPWSSTVIRTVDSAPSPKSRAEASMLVEMRTNCPRRENLIALERPLPRAWSRRRRSPTKTALSISRVRGSTAREMPRWLAVDSKQDTPSWRSVAMEKGAGTSCIRPLSMRSKSSMSDTMFSMSSVHVLSTVMDWRGLKPELLREDARALEDCPREGARTWVPPCSSDPPSSHTIGPADMSSAVARTARSGLRRSCMTTRMSLARASAATSAFMARALATSSFFLVSRQSLARARRDLR